MEENAGQFTNNLGSYAHYARLGTSFYAESSDPTWPATSCVSKKCCASGKADFTLSNNNPKEEEFISLYNNSPYAPEIWWIINGDTIPSTSVGLDSLVYAFPLGMNLIQLVTFGADCISVKTMLLDVWRTKYPCGFDPLMEWRRLNNPNYSNMIQRRKTIQNSNFAKSSATDTFYIPVVFHIIADNQARLNSFSATRIQTQLDVLNNQFANNTTDVIFCLAQNLPTGITKTQWSEFGTASTPGQEGITYTLDSTGNTLTTFDYLNGVHLATLFDSLSFPPEQYLSIYIVDEVMLPDSTLVAGIANPGPTGDDVDGIAIQYDAFVNGVNAPMGKVLVHEAGHWLGLLHVFGQDNICDTYFQIKPTSDSIPANNCTIPYSDSITIASNTYPRLGCIANPPYNKGENHMDYHSDSCLSIFTGGQIDEMHEILIDDRPFIHSDLNLVNTGVRKIGGCLDLSSVIADFSLSENGVCASTNVVASGANQSYDYWEWSISWNPANNFGAPEPTNVSITIGPVLGENISPFGYISISESGNWDVIINNKRHYRW